MGNDSIILETRNIEHGDIKSNEGQNLVEVVAAVNVKYSDGNNKEKDKGKEKEKNEVMGGNSCQGKDLDNDQNPEQFKSRKESHGIMQNDNASLILNDSWPEDWQAIFQHLCDQQMEISHCKTLINEAIQRQGKNDTGKMGLQYQMIRESIIRNIPTHNANSGNCEKYNVMALIGTAGIGKTTVISRMVQKTREYSDKDILLISIKGNSIEKLHKIADFTGATVWVVTTPQELREIMDEFKNFAHIFIDTPGINYLYNDTSAGLKMFFDVIPDREIHLVVSAVTRYIDSIKIVRKCTAFPVHKLLFTRADETDLYGTLFSVAMETQIPVSFITGGDDSSMGIRPATTEMVAEMVLRL